MYRVFLGLICLSLPFLFVWVGERARRDPERYKTRFMADNGLTRSFVALRYIGEPEVAQREFVTNARVRNAWIIEGYVWAVISFVTGIAMLCQAVLEVAR